MKRIDRLLISSFIPPFIVTFMIAIFVLLMQMLWLYIDDIAGKGVGFFILIELLAYKCVSLIPMALPLAVLISSVMVLGNMAEHYELSSFKSAGVALHRIMRPLMFMAFGATIFSFLCSNNLIPVANLKFGSRMYDIQRQKPALQLDVGIFNYDFRGYAIHIGHKGKDDQTIKEVLMYDHAEADKGRLSQIVAEEGEMYSTPDGKFFIMDLKNGHQYVETNPTTSSKDKSFPFVRTSFGQWVKVFDLGEFELNRTNEELFKSNRHMMTSGQLAIAADSITQKIEERKTNLANHVSNYFFYIENDTTFAKEQQMPNGYEDEEEQKDSLEILAQEAEQKKVNTKPQPDNNTTEGIETKALISQTIEENTNKNKAAKKKKVYSANPLEQLDVELDSLNNFAEIFHEKERNRLFNKASTFTRSIHGQAETSLRSLDRMMESRVKHVYEMHTKYSMAVVCFIFLFVGAPMGAIVRKGGFGYPILISIISFMVFIVLTIFCRKIAETFVVPAAMAAWIPCAILFPVGLILTYKAMNDSKLLNMDRYTAFFRKIFKRKKSTEE
jgi:lipopolysaccharide export system permease protein